MFTRQLKAFFVMSALLISLGSYAQCYHCSAPAAPAEWASGNLTMYKNAVLQLWAFKPSVAVDSRQWYRVKSAGDTTFVGTGDTMTFVMDTTCRFIARNVNNCTCGGTYYSAYTQMASITVVDSPSVPQYMISYDSHMCSGSQTNISVKRLTTLTGVSFQYYRDDTPNVTGNVSGNFVEGPLGITLTNHTGSNQQVRFMIRMYKSGVYYDSKSFYITVTPDSPSVGDHCKFPTAPKIWPFPPYYYAQHSIGAHVLLVTDTTITADGTDWYKVIGTDTTYVGSGSRIEVVIDSICQYIARNSNFCNCDSSTYYSSYALMSQMPTGPGNRNTFHILNYTPIMASGTETDIVLRSDSGYSSYFELWRDNALVTGSTYLANATSIGSNSEVFATKLTNTTSVAQLVRFYIRGSKAGVYYGDTYMGYITVLPAQDSAAPGNHCTVPPKPSANVGSSTTYIKGATIYLNLQGTTNLTGAYNIAVNSGDYIDYFKSKGPGDTVYVGSGIPQPVIVDTTIKLYAISNNICTWSDGSQHTYKSAPSYLNTVLATNGTSANLKMINKKPAICNGDSVQIIDSIYASTPGVFWYRSNQQQVLGTYSSSTGTTSVGPTISPVLTDTGTAPQRVDFISFSKYSSSVYNSQHYTSVTIYPDCSKWTNFSTAITGMDTICSGDTATLTADTVPGIGSHYTWSTGDTTKTIHPTASGTYTVTVTNSCGCSATSTINLVVLLPVASITNDSLPAGSDIVVLIAHGGVNYFWNTRETTDTVMEILSGTYTVTVSDAFGCTASASMIVNLPVDTSTCGSFHTNRTYILDSLGIQRDMRMYDRFGNEYLPSDIAFDSTGRSTAHGRLSAPCTNCSCVAGMFTLIFEDVLEAHGYGFDDATNGAARRATACQVYSDLSNLLYDVNPTNGGRVNIWINSEQSFLNVINIYTPFPINSLGVGSSFMSAPRDLRNAIMDGEVWKTIKSGYSSYGINLYPPANTFLDYYHGYLAVDFSSATYNTDLTSNSVTSSQVDLYSVILHQAIHTLGFTSLIRSNGTSYVVVSNSHNYSRYDLFLKYNTTTPLLTFNSTANTLNYTAGTTSLNANCNSGTALTFTGSNCINQPVYSSAPWNPDISLCHFGCVPSVSACDPLYYGQPTSDYSMNPCTGTGAAFVKRHPNTEEVEALCDLGYPLAATSGTAVYGTNTYPTNGVYETYSQCANGSNACVAVGTQDGGYSTYWHTPIAISFSDLMQNDFNTTNVNDVSVVTPGAGTISLTGTGFIYTPSLDFSGRAILAYYPTCSGSSTFGNITFVFVDVAVPPTPVCSPSSCNLICGGDFEWPAADYINIAGGYTPCLMVKTSSNNVANWYGLNQYLSTGNMAWGCNLLFTMPQPAANGGNRYFGLTGTGFDCSAGYGAVSWLDFPLSSPMTSSCNSYTFNILGRVPAGNGCLGPMALYIYGSNVAYSDVCNPPQVLLGTINMSGNVWTNYSLTLNPSTIAGFPSGGVNYLTIVPTDGLASGFGSQIVLLDNVELKTNCSQSINVAQTVSSTTPSICDNINLTYTVCLASGQSGTNTNPVDLQLSIPSGFSIIPGGSFDATGYASIPASTISTSICQTLSLSLSMDLATVTPGTLYTVQIGSTTSNNCFSSSSSFYSQIRPTSPVSISSTTLTSCSANNFSYTPGGTPGGTTYAWSSPTLSAGLSGGGGAQSLQSNFHDNLTNTTTTSQTAIYSVTPTSSTGACSGAAFTVTVTIEPVPVISSQTTSICPSTALSYTPTGTIPAGTTYSWSAPTLSSGLSGSLGAQSGQTNIHDNITATTSGTATYTVTPTSGTCMGAAFTLTVTVGASNNVIHILSGGSGAGGQLDIQSMVHDGDGNIYIAGAYDNIGSLYLDAWNGGTSPIWSAASPDDKDYFLIKFDCTGNIDWSLKAQESSGACTNDPSCKDIMKISATGNIYWCYGNSGQHYIQRVNSSGTPSFSPVLTYNDLGYFGDGDVDASGVYVNFSSDNGTNLDCQILKLTSGGLDDYYNGTFTSSDILISPLPYQAANNTSANPFRSRMKVFEYGGTSYMCLASSNFLAIFNATTGALIDNYTGTGLSGTVCKLDVDPTGALIFVTDGAAVSKYSFNGTAISGPTILTLTGVADPMDVKCFNGNIIVANYNHLVEYSYSGGTPIRTYNDYVSGTPSGTYERSIDVYDNTHVYVCGSSEQNTIMYNGTSILDNSDVRAFVMRFDNTGTAQKTSGIISTHNDSGHFEVFPNPTSSYITVNYEIAERMENATLKVHDILGNLVVTKDLLNTSGTANLDLSFLASGSYTISLNNSSKVLSTRLVIKQ